MPAFFLWTPADFGTVGFSTSGTFTMTGTPDVIDVTDDDLLFSDGTADPSSPQDTGNPQVLTTDIVLDGVVAGTAGQDVQNAAEATITNSTTGEVGRLVYVTVGDNGTGAGFVGYASTIDISPGDEFTISSLNISEEEAYANLVVCFASGTCIKTQDGEKPIECLQVGDMLLTLDHGPQPIRWIGRRTLSGCDLRDNENLRPIRIRAGALAVGVPLRDLIVSPQHRILVRSKIAMRMFDTYEIFVPAKHLLNLDGVEVADDMQSVTYFHTMCDEHEIVIADGACAETLYTGTEAMKAMKAMSPEAKEEIGSIFGEMPYLNRPLARHTPKGKFAKKLVERHKKNRKELVQSD